ncbi:MAG: hypothetical protein PHV68_01975 [Candidatus Gastranaerophilales bacterium]|nr:hypothetical protein [Candidatus Gastranaerophilales bacterium]
MTEQELKEKISALEIQLRNELAEVKLHVAKVETCLGFFEEDTSETKAETTGIHQTCEKRLEKCNERFGKIENSLTKYAVMLGIIVALLVKGLDWVMGKI